MLEVVVFPPALVQVKCNQTGVLFFYVGQTSNFEKRQKQHLTRYD